MTGQFAKGKAELGRTLKGSEIIADLRAGMKSSEVMKKYALSPRELKSVLRQVRRERDARICRIAADLMKGMPHDAVMQKHGISPAGLKTVLEVFSVELAIEMPALSSQSSDVCDQVVIDFRNEPRHKPLGVILAQAHLWTIRECVIRDISQHGLGLVGARAPVDEICTVSILGNDSGLVEPFELKALCRWAGMESKLGKPMAGFRIEQISPSDSLKLRQLIESYTISP